MAMAALPEIMPEARVLVVDDETNIVELLSVSLKFQGFEVYTASNGPAALDKAREVRPDAVILDVMMPGMDGFGLLRRLRADGIDAPALFLTARDTLQDKITGLTLGGDDYVTKPFSLEEVVARLRVILRRTGRGVEEPRNARLTFADIELDEDTHEVWKAGQPVSLSPTEFTLLRYFIINAGTVLSANPRSSITYGATTSAGTSTSSSPTSPTCAARSTPARNACCTHCAALATFSANRGNFWRTIEEWPDCTDEASL